MDPPPSTLRCSSPRQRSRGLASLISADHDSSEY